MYFLKLFLRGFAVLAAIAAVIGTLVTLSRSFPLIYALVSGTAVFVSACVFVGFILED